VAVAIGMMAGDSTIGLVAKGSIVVVGWFIGGVVVATLAVVTGCKWVGLQATAVTHTRQITIIQDCLIKEFFMLLYSSRNKVLNVGPFKSKVPAIAFASGEYAHALI
jgi:hypothetical protein